jgi:hypothetical protein
MFTLTFLFRSLGGALSSCIRLCVHNVHFDLSVQEPGRRSFLLYIMLQQMETLLQPYKFKVLQETAAKGGPSKEVRGQQDPF